MLYTFFGSKCQLGSQELKVFGAEIELDNAEVKVAVIGGATLIPKADFDSIEFTPEMLQKRRNRRGDEYQKKFHSALDKLWAFRATLKDGTFGKAAPAAASNNKVGVKLTGKK